MSQPYLVTGGNGTVLLAFGSSSIGTLNLGTGGAAGTLNATTVSVGSGTAVVNFNHTGSYTFDPLTWWPAQRKFS